jgi:hypothetical protein
MLPIARRRFLTQQISRLKRQEVVWCLLLGNADERIGEITMLGIPNLSAYLIAIINIGVNMSVNMSVDTFIDTPVNISINNMMLG